VTKNLLLLALSILAVMAAGDRGWAQAPGAVGQPQFATSSLNGVCGFTAASTNVNPSSGSFLAPRANVGTLSFNGAGSVTLIATQNKEGTIQSIGPEIGPYSVGGDGRTGTIDFTAAGGPLVQFEIVNLGSELRFMNTGPVDATLGFVKEVMLGVCQF